MSHKKFTSRNDRSRQKVLQKRVLDAIREQQNTGEQLVGWFQLAVVSLFGLLYMASPKTFSLPCGRCGSKPAML